MLILSRKKDEKILIGDNIEITILWVGNSRVRIGIEAPTEIRILTKEEEVQAFLKANPRNKIPANRTKQP